MAYRQEKNPETGKPEIVIDGWEDGIAASPYQGIASLKNLNIRYLPGAVYSNYKRNLNSPSSGIGLPKYWTKDPTTGRYFIVDSNGKIWSTTNPSTVAWTEFTGNSGHYGQGQGICVFKNFLFVFKANSIDYCDLQNFNTWNFDWKTGLPNGEHMALWGQDDILYFCNSSPVTTAGSSVGSITALTDILTTLTAPPVVTDVTADLIATWIYPTGTYTVHFSNGESRIGTFANGSATFTWTGGLASDCPTSSVQIDIPFAPNVPLTYTYNPQTVTLPGFEPSIVWLSELQTNLMVAAGKSLYPFDRSSATALLAGVPTGVPVPLQENITRVINIMNKLYLTAGVKGNIYISNGYSTSPWVKIPDSFFGVIDPGILFGDMMAHRNKLYVGVSLFQSPAFNGVFSIDLDTKIINFENQNSYGENASGVSAPYGQPNILIDLESAAYDNYASAWYDGSKGGMDTNSTNLYTNGETVIETDLINVGTYLYPKTHVNIEFKLDKPMSTGDIITVYGRQSLSASYVQLGQTSAQAVLSDVFTPLALQKSQWLQLKIVLDQGDSTNFIRLREVRIR